MISVMEAAFPGRDVNVVFARGMPLDRLTQGLRGLRREPLASGEADGWAWAVHDMLNPDEDGYEGVSYERICPVGTELVVFVTQPCSAKAHAPDFAYHRDGRLVLGFSFEGLHCRVGDNPDYLSPELLAAGLIGSDEDGEHDQDELLAQVITDFFGLPVPQCAPEGGSR
ncbi:DUF6461 domain-containing protein [Streptomyces sp. CC210A]|uniref:DUF6461 domain-containing protein n=1 Tax=Streptomyces sp. CC210A TaxID=2898184 RepID=UPI001F38D99F|nr:hypothetical protein [Streptomyces sp. CC210A]